MAVFTKTGQLFCRLVQGAIHRLWVQPLETFVIPCLSVERPNQARSLLLRWFTWFADAGRVLLEDLRLHVTRWAGSDWSVTYIGNGFSVEALVSILFPDPPETCSNTPAYLWQVPPLVRKFTAEGDLVVCELNRIIHLSPKNVDLSFTTPQWIKQVLQGIDKPLDEVLSKFHSTVRRRIRKLEDLGYSYTTTHSEADFDLFYHRMYVPYIGTRHNGHGAIVRGFDHVHRIFENGILLLVKRCDEPVSGSICRLSDDTCHWVLMGVMDGQFELVKNGANVALFWLAIQWAQDQGARCFDFGLSLPLITDGVFNFKRQWGGRIVPDREIYSQWKFFGKGIPGKLQDHLNEKGFISEISGDHYQVMLVKPGQLVTEADLAARAGSIVKCGLKGILTISSGGKQKRYTCSASHHSPSWSTSTDEPREDNQSFSVKTAV